MKKIITLPDFINVLSPFTDIPKAFSLLCLIADAEKEGLSLKYYWFEIC